MNLVKPEVSLATSLRRTENRYNYSMTISVRTKALSCQGQTINVSNKGIKFTAPSQAEKLVSVDDIIYISIPELNEYLESFLVGNETKKALERFVYQIVHIEYKETEAIVACKYVGQSISDILMLESYIEDKLHLCQIDLTHEFDNIKYSFYEHLRFDYLSELVFYYIPSESCSLFIKSERNRYIYGYVTHRQQKYPDLTPFLTPSSLNYVIQNSDKLEDFYLYLYWKEDKLFFQYSFEINSQQALISLIHQVKKYKGYVLKGYGIPTSQGDSTYEQFVDLDEQKQITFQFVFYDISNFVTQCSYELLALDTKMPDLVADPFRKPEEKLQQKNFLYNSHCERAENRHLFKTGLRVSVDKYNYVEATSVDFSYTGMGILLSEVKGAYNIGTKIWIDFYVLNEQMQALDLKNIPFSIKNIIPCQFSEFTQLGLIRDVDNCPDTINQFFDIIVERNRLTLPLCTQDKLGFMKKQLVQERFQNSLHSIPIFLSANEHNDFYIKEIKIYNKMAKLPQFFMKGDGFDFSCITRQLLVKKFAEYISQKRYYAKPFVAFFIKVDNDIRVITNEEVLDNTKLNKIAIDTIKKDGVCVLINFYENKSFNEQAFELSIMKSASQELKELDEAREQVKDIRGYMELLDITSYFKCFIN